MAATSKSPSVGDLPLLPRRAARWALPGVWSAALQCAAAALALVATTGIAAGLGGTQPLWRPVCLALALVFAAVLLHGVWRLVRHTAEAADALHRFAQRVGTDGGSSLMESRRGDSALATSMLDEVAGEVEQVLDERERRWKARARLSADWYWETDEHCRMSWVSEDLGSHLKLGLAREELLGRRHDEVAHYGAPEGGWKVLNDRLEARKSFRGIEIEVRRPGRSVVWVALSGRPRRDGGGRFVGYAGVGRDVTEQRLAFRRLRDSERRYAVIADFSADWYWESDAGHRLSHLGTLAHEQLGEALAGALGEPRWLTHASGASDAEWARHREDLDAHRRFVNFEFVVRRPGRGAVWVSVSGAPRFDAAGAFTGYHGVGRDITLRKRAEKVLLSRNAELERLVADRTSELERSNRDLEAFSRQLAHELRTPIGHVVGFADLLRTRAAGRLTADELEWLRLSAQSGRAMSATVTALLELARSGSEPVVREAVDLSALAAGLIAELPPQQRRAGVTWQIEPAMVAQCGGPLLRVVLSNLLSNAAKFTREAAAPRVSFGIAGRERGQVVYCVADNGAGFEPGQAAQLFQPFVRLHGQARFEGTGVGLSIVRRVVERHGGWVRASASVGGGARFEFTLAPPLLDAGENTDDEPAETA